MKRLIAILLILIVSLPALGGIRNVGNGGMGVFEGNELYLLDLIDVGVHLDTFFDYSLQPDQRVHDRLMQKMPFLDKVTANLFVLKFVEIQKNDPVLAYILVSTMEMFNWSLKREGISTGGRSFEVEVDSVPSKYTTVVLIAERLMRQIGIDFGFWEKLNPPNRAALLYHEIIYAVMPVSWTGQAVTSYDVPMSRAELALRARAVVGEFFKAPYDKRRIDQIGVFPPRPDAGPNLAVGFVRGGFGSTFVSYRLYNNESTGYTPNADFGLKGTYHLTLTPYSEGPRERAWYIRLKLKTEK